MKKIIVLIICLISMLLLVFRVNANEVADFDKPLVVSVDTDITDYLIMDGYVVISNTVNTHQVGTYHVIYKNITTLEEIERMVYVIDADTLFLPTTKERVEADEVQYEYLDGVKYLDHIAYLYRYKSPSYYGSHYYLKLDNATSKVVINNGLLEDARLNYQDGTFLVVGTTNSVMDGTKSIYYKVLANTSKQATLDTGANEVGSAIACSESLVFVAGKTNEVSDAIPGKRDGFDSFILFCDRSTLNITNTLVLGGAGDDEIVDMYYSDHYLYALQIRNDRILRLLKIDLFGNIVGENQLNYNYGIKDAQLLMDKGQLYLSFSYYDYHYLDYVDRIDMISPNLERTIIYEQYYNLMKLVDFDISESGLLQIIMGFKNNQKGYCYQVYDGDTMLLSDYQNINQTPKRIANEELVTTFSSGYEITNLNSVIVRKAPPTFLASSEKVNEFLKDCNVLINLKKVAFDEQSKINGLDNCFGSYQNSYHFDAAITYIRSQELKIAPSIGATDFGVYDLGLVIDGNAVVRVNGELVSLPYQFNEAGHYTLELTGFNQEMVTMNIEITQLSVTNEKETISPTLDLNAKPSPVNPDSTLIFSKRTTSNQMPKWSFIVYLIPIMALGIGFLVLRRGK